MRHLAALALLLCPYLAVAQQPTSSSSQTVPTPTPPPPMSQTKSPGAPAWPTPTFLDGDTYFSTVFAGAGISSDGTVRPVSAQFGASAGMETLGGKAGDLGMMQFIETGAIGPLAGRTAPAAFLGYDLGVTLLPSRDSHVAPFAVAGYSYVFSQASAVNFGVGVDLHYSVYRAIRVEVRDYYTLTQAPQHNLALRIGWQFSAYDP